MSRQLAGSTSDLFAPVLVFNGSSAVPGRLVRVGVSDVGLDRKRATLLDVEAPFASVQHAACSAAMQYLLYHATIPPDKF